MNRSELEQVKDEINLIRKARMRPRILTSTAVNRLVFHSTHTYAHVHTRTHTHVRTRTLSCVAFPFLLTPLSLSLSLSMYVRT